MKVVGRRTNALEAGEYFCGIDGGGTKTIAHIVDRNGKLILKGRDAGSNPNRVGVEVARNHIAKAVVNAFEDTGYGFQKSIIKGLYIGLAGIASEAQGQNILAELLRAEELSGIPARITGDEVIALYDVCGNGPGVVLIAGTGAVATGRNREGKRETCDGLGPVLGDRGSGYKLARSALDHIGRYFELNIASTLKVRALQHFGVSNYVELAREATRLENEPDGVAHITDFARVVGEEANDSKDRLAVDLVLDAGHELGETLATVVQKLDMQAERFPVGLCGSLFEIGELIKKPIRTRLKDVAPKASIRRGKVNPARAASQMALREFGV